MAASTKVYLLPKNSVVLKGETISCVGYWSGFITESSTAVKFSVPLLKLPIGIDMNDDTNNYKMTGVFMQIRQNGKYLYGGSAGGQLFNGTHSAYIYETSMLVTLYPTFAATPVNNSECTIQIYRGHFTFS